MCTHYSLIYSTHNGDDAPQNSKSEVIVLLIVAFTVSQTVECQMVGRLQKDELERIWKEVIAQSKYYCGNYLEESRNTTKS
jgi:hypothetical protein